MRDLVGTFLFGWLASIDLGDADTRATYVALIYFGTFITLGAVGKFALHRWMARHGEDLAEVQRQAGPSRRKVQGFLLGIWYRK